MAVDLGIGHLRDIELIGRGGFSIVYAATDERTGRRVAVKVIHAASDRIHRSFERERAVMARLSAHPHVVTLYDSGYSPDGRPYLSMELIDGGTLAERVSRQGPLPWRVAVNHLLPIAGALEFAHSQQVLHRDVKPENILQADGQPRLTDFGIASLRDATGYTTTHVAASWGYTAPETLENQRDERSDLYSLGSTLYMLVTGVPPFAGDGNASIQSLMYRLVNQAPPRLPSDLAPAALDDVVQACLAKDPAQRPQSASELVGALRPLLPASPVAPRRSARPEPVERAAGDPTSPEALPAVAGVAAGAGIGRLRRYRVSPLAMAGAAVSVGALALALSLATGGDPAPPALSSTDTAFAAVTPEDAALAGHRGTVTRLVVLPDGRLASASVDRTVRVWDPAQPAVFPIVLRDLPAPVTALAALGDGRLALAGDDGTVTIRTTGGDGTEPVALTGGPPGPVTALTALGDGRLAAAGSDGTVVIWPTTGAPAADPVVLQGVSTGGVTALTALADGRVAAGTGEGALLIWDPGTGDGKPAVVLTGHQGASVTALVGLADGRIASAGTDGTVRLWDADDGAASAGPVFADHAGPVDALAALADGRIASGSADGSVKVWDPDEIPLGVRTVYRPEGAVTALAALPDGRLATAGADDRAIQLWRPAPGGS